MWRQNDVNYSVINHLPTLSVCRKIYNDVVCFSWNSFH